MNALAKGFVFGTPAATREWRRLSAAILLLLPLAISPTYAIQDLMVIQEVFVGPPGEAGSPLLAPDARAQYVMLRMTSSFQSFVDGTFIRVEDVDGNLLGRFGTLVGVVGNDGIGCPGYPGCPAIIIGTQAARNQFTFAFDQIVDNQAGRVALPAEGGRACFMDFAGTGVFDCVAWGNFDCTVSGNCAGPNTIRIGDFPGNGCDTDFGTPAAPNGLQFGFSLARNAYNCGNFCEVPGDCKDNSADLSLRFPRPVNNAGANDNLDLDNDTLIDQLDCDALNAAVLWPPSEVRNVMLTGVSNTTIFWDSQSSTAGSAVRYDVARGSLSVVDGFSDAVCHDSGTPLASTADATPVPLADGFYYLIRAQSGPECIGSYGAGRGAVDPVCP